MITPSGAVTDSTTLVPAAGEPIGGVLVLPGGGYERHAPHEAEPYAEWLAALGYDAYVLRYPVGPHAWPAALIGARAALRHVRSRTPVHLPVGVIGSSAGGHLAAALSTAGGQVTGDGAGQRPDFAILAYPVISFEVHPHPGSTHNILGTNPSRGTRVQVSFDRHVDRATPPTFVWTTADDATVPATHSLRYAQALIEAGVSVELHVFPHGRHGLGLGRDNSTIRQWTDLCEGWLRRGCFEPSGLR
ncbi:alpha/beta hydrolase [Cellulomonas sp. KRMCY2]|uniref:alpha/beta hydrolase n=1 Tax=Cellulomonas sp. KRMCY2 TaxID=1304865 RepID=UPI00045E7687|nr:alpha/beta hydrolase [Cellulomonas sp. KRMCY2]